MAATLDRG